MGFFLINQPFVDHFRKSPYTFQHFLESPFDGPSLVGSSVSQMHADAASKCGIINWLVVTGCHEFYFPITGGWFGCHPPIDFPIYIYILGISSSQLTFIFFRGVQTTNQLTIFIDAKALGQTLFGPRRFSACLLGFFNAGIFARWKKPFPRHQKWYPHNASRWTAAGLWKYSNHITEGY